jgi:hypothetical protein
MSSKKGSWWSNKHRKYKYSDKKKGYLYDLTLDQARAIMSLPCYFCCRAEARGLDRIDNSKGHELSNVLPCCFKCNMILTDLPLPAKIEMRESLRNLREKGLVDNWQPAYNSFDKQKNEDVVMIEKIKCLGPTTASEVSIQLALKFLKESEESNDQSGTRVEETDSIGC